MDNRAIGVFDSGLGGLTGVQRLYELLPNENIVYFGDTGRVPYGSKSRETIEEYARQDENFLLSKNVKIIIAACGTVSSVAAHTGDDLPVPFMGVVEPTARLCAKSTKSNRIGVIGTSATVNSGAYEKALLKINKDFKIKSRACPLFVPLVEEVWIDNDIVAKICVERYLKEIKDFGVDTLILGCTHYPLIADTIAEYMGSDVTLISAGDAVARECAEVLKNNDMLNDGNTAPSHKFYVTDRPDGFARTADIFLKGGINGSVEQVRI